jgi:hypothetical protein
MLLESRLFGTEVRKNISVNPRNNRCKKAQKVVEYRYLCTDFSDDADIDFTKPIVSNES